MIKPNGTDAKDIALHFLKVTSGRVTPHIMAKTVNQAKSLLLKNYSKEEIINVIDYLVKKGINMYSLGYVNTAINSVLSEMRKEQSKERANIEKKKLSEALAMQGEVEINAESAERNRGKIGRFGIQSRLREKFDFDCFE